MSAVASSQRLRLGARKRSWHSVATAAEIIAQPPASIATPAQTACGLKALAHSITSTTLISNRRQVWSEAGSSESGMSAGGDEVRRRRRQNRDSDEPEARPLEAEAPGRRL